MCEEKGETVQMEGLDIIWYGSWWACKNWVLEIKLSNPFISHSITPQVFPSGSFLSQLSFAMIWRWKAKKTKLEFIFKSLWKSNFSLTSTFPSQWFIVSILWPWLRMRNVRPDKLLRRNVMLYYNVVYVQQCGRQMGAPDIWVVQHNLPPARNVCICKMTKPSNMNDPLFLHAGGSTNIIIPIRFNRSSCVSIGPCFD